MHAIRLHAFGPPENLTYEKTDDPVPGPGQVRIAVAAAGVHLVDAALRRGVTPGGIWPAVELPTIPGREVAGTVESVGEGVARSWLGQRVSAHLGMVPGGYAELAVTGTETLHPLPDNVSEGQAVAVLGTGRMAMGLLRFAPIEPGDTVLVLAAAGGIGSLLVQYAAHRGATVIGAAGGRDKVEAVRRLGADLAVDYDRPDWPEAVLAAFGERPVRHLFEGVGGERARAAIGLLAPGGGHVAYGTASSGLGGTELANPTPEEQAALGITSQVALGPALFERIGGLERLRTLEDEALALVGDGVLVPLVQEFPLADAAGAHRALESRATMGKVVLRP
ncbi:zinc-binding dehydrogenase [Streptomyces sp. 3MP-14]|uniref:Zinc-binding dehydrogenase n=1 Tax=Streptomyces mimosae TaxID=2586635 RepID=A0A5N6AG94_9ACTN|nr:MULTISPECIES: zinc-binding dehydrogenase [Streptomyces]KAB8167083.1 zinc-binding dehydrogenase [Streptomyces mimosae]KAB8177024.1 zinc-binding dehydrogenase [Streptomyces sp. 3MP-14]